MKKRKPVSKTKAVAIREYVDALKSRSTIERDVHIDAFTEEYLAGKPLRGNYIIPKIITTPMETKKSPWWKKLLAIHN